MYFSFFQSHNGSVYIIMWPVLEAMCVCRSIVCTCMCVYVGMCVCNENKLSYVIWHPADVILQIIVARHKMVCVGVCVHTLCVCGCVYAWCECAHMLVWVRVSVCMCGCASVCVSMCECVSMWVWKCVCMGVWEGVHACTLRTSRPMFWWIAGWCYFVIHIPARHVIKQYCVKGEVIMWDDLDQ